MERYEDERDLETTDADSARDTTIEDLRGRLKAQEEKAAGYLANWQRAQADLENLRKRVQQERVESEGIAGAALMRRLIGALDDLERAFSRPASEMCDTAWAEGAKLSFQVLKNALESEGLKQIEALDTRFDPRYHEAIMRRPGPEGVVVEEVQKGYTFNGRVLRPSRVVVGTSETESEDQE